MPHVVDHVIARQHGGPTELENLALACGLCNHSKGPNIAGLDPAAGELTRVDFRRVLLAHGVPF